MKKVLFIVSLFLVNLALGQQAAEEVGFEKVKINRPSVIFKLSLTSWLDFTSSSINFGIEKTISKKWSIHQEVGYINNHFNPIYNTIRQINVQGMKYNIEPRLYFNDERTIKGFIALSVLYKFDAQQIENETFRRFGGQYNQIFDYNKNRHMISFTPTGGLVELNYSKKVGVAFSGGIGIRVVHITRSKNIPDDAESTANISSILPKEIGTYIRPNMVVKLALIFGKTKH